MSASLWTSWEGKWSWTSLFFPRPRGGKEEGEWGGRREGVGLDETAALYLSTLINITTINHFTFQMRRLSACVQNTWEMYDVNVQVWVLEKNYECGRAEPLCALCNFVFYILIIYVAEQLHVLIYNMTALSCFLVCYNIIRICRIRVSYICQFHITKTYFWIIKNRAPHLDASNNPFAVILKTSIWK